jgi:hypothetical protein
MNEKACLITLRWNIGILIVIAGMCFYSIYLEWQFDKNPPGPYHYQQELLLKIDNLVKDGRPLGIGSTPNGMIIHNFTIAKMKPPLTAEQRAHLELFLETQKAAHLDTVPLWNINDSSVDYPSRRETTDNITRFILALFVSLQPAIITLGSLAAKAAKDSYRIWVYGEIYVIEPIPERSACILTLLLGCAICSIGYFSVMMVGDAEPELVFFAALLQPLLLLEMFSIYRETVFTRVRRLNTLASSSWWFIY